MKQHMTQLIIMLLISLFALHAEIRVQYEPEYYLIFRKGNDVPTSSFSPTGFNQNRIVAHIGTITITATEGEPIIRPILEGFGTTNGFMFNGPLTGWGGGNHDTEFQIYGVTTTRRTPFGVWFESGNGGDAEFILESGTVNANPYVVELFFRGIQPSSLYILGENYVMVDGSLGAFNVKLKPSNSWNYFYVPVNNQEIPTDGSPPADPIPIPVGGSGVPIPTVPYGVDPPELIHLFTIIQDDPFPIHDAYGPSKQIRVGKAQITMQNAVQGGIYGVNITFSSNQGGPEFQLHLQGEPTYPFIPYELKFMGQKVNKGQAIAWSPLGIPFTSEDIFVTNISESIAEAAPSGYYSDTILVEITAIE
ncbi:hypothetical protein SDC9_110586 [bioreactor metagenome]|uniref:Uncharacterized protein n=1 Tax=bioreactor metagenome TaxID=1076179 RepID=A0A645BPI2_9ZZZZ